MGNNQYHAIGEWETLYGEMGLYQSMQSEGIAGEQLLLIVLVDDKVNIRMYSARQPEIAVNDAKMIARFADATLILRQHPEAGVTMSDFTKPEVIQAALDDGVSTAVQIETLYNKMRLEIPTMLTCMMALTSEVTRLRAVNERLKAENEALKATK